jgi:hypothetical protein
MSLSLVILAAGVGSRYGGPKQIDRLGPGGATLIDYAAYDARRAGFDRLVLITKEGDEADMREAVGDRIARHLPLTYAIQAHDPLPGVPAPAGRRKPWGTGHAALAGARVVDGPFAMVNADDFYGRGAYQALAHHLRAPRPAEPAEFSLVGYPIATVLSPDGPVSRGVCSVDPSGSYLVSIREVLKVERAGDDAREIRDDGTSALVPGATPVSLNCWGFTPALLPALERGFSAFLREHGNSTKAEYFLLSAVQDTIDAGHARVRVLGGGGPWAGLTYPGDRPRMQALLEGLVARGEYPRDLWAA